MWVQDDQSLPSSTPASSSRDPLEHEGKVEIASCTSAAGSTAGSATSDGPEHLASSHWRFEGPNLILDTEAGKVLALLVSDPDIRWCICSLDCQCQSSHAHPCFPTTLRAYVFLSTASAFVFCFCNFVKSLRLLLLRLQCAMSFHSVVHLLWH